MLTLGQQELHLWRIDLEECQLSEAPDPSNLSTEELARAKRFRFAKDRRCYLTVRRALRQLLSVYLDLEAGSITIATADKGKPYLPGHPELRFNISHAGKYALLAFCYGREVGVDVELVDRSFAVEPLFERYFSPLEIQTLSALPTRDRHEAFFLAWTRKEAVIKAHGDGLSLPLNEFGVTILMEEAVRLLHTDWAPAEVTEWQLASFMVGVDAPGAVAYRGSRLGTVFYDYSLS